MTHFLPRIALFLLIVFPAQGIAQDSKSIKVLNAQFETIAVLASSDMVANFESIWNTRSEVTGQVKPSWKYKLDLIGFKPGGRWLYDPAGYIKKLAHNKTKLYSISPANQFNSLLGIKE